MGRAVCCMSTRSVGSVTLGGERACASLLLSFLLLCCGLHSSPPRSGRGDGSFDDRSSSRGGVSGTMRRQHRWPQSSIGSRRIRKEPSLGNAAAIASTVTLSAAAGAAAEVANNSGPQTVESGSCSVLAELEKEAAEDHQHQQQGEALRNGKIKCAVLEEMIGGRKGRRR